MQKTPRKSQNEFQRTTKHFFWQDYFLHMWPASKAKHFEPIEHNFLIKWFKMNLLPCNPFLGPNSSKCTKILSQRHPFMFFSPSHFLSCKDTFMDDYDGI
jgi:hypothetical protein